MKFGNNIDLSLNQLIHAVLYNNQSLAGDSDFKVNGHIYFNTGNNHPMIFQGAENGTGGNWRKILLDNDGEISSAMLASNSLSADKFSAVSHNKVLAGPSATNASDAVPTFRSLVAADIPDLSGTYATSARVTTLESYKTALNVTKSAWGQNYWVNGEPKDISGSLSSVGKITFTSQGTTPSSSGNVLEVITVGGNPVLHSVLPFYSDSWVASGGVGSGGGGGSLDVYGSSSLGGSFSDSVLTNTFNAYTINKIYTDFRGLFDANDKILTQYLPSYVDDVLEYSSRSAFPATGETGKIYVALDTNLTYRWGGSNYVEISPSLALGETSTTAYRGDRGKTAYEHSQKTGENPHLITLSLLSDTTITSLADGQTIIYDATAHKWKNADSADIFPLNNAIAENKARIDDIEAWTVKPNAAEAYIGELGAMSINLGGVDVWNESNVALIGGSLTVRDSDTSGSFVKAEVTGSQIGLLAQTSNRGVWDFSRSTPDWLIATNGTNSWLSCGNVGIGTSSPSYKLHVNGTLGISDSLTLTGEPTSSPASNHQKITFGTNAAYGYIEVVDLGTGGSHSYALHTTLPLYSDKWIASGGIGQAGGGGGGLVEAIYRESDLGGTFDDSDNDTFDAYTINSIHTRLSAVEGACFSGISESGSGFVTGIARGTGSNSNTLIVTKANLTAAQVNTALGVTITKQTTGFTIAGGTTSKTLTVNETYTLGAACAKSVVSSESGITSSATGLPTAGAVYSFVGTQVSSGVSGIIHVYKVKRSNSDGTWTATSGDNAYKEFTVGYDFSTDDLVTSLYDDGDGGNLVMTDVQIVKNNSNKYAVRLNFAKSFDSSNTGETFRLVVYGK